MRFLLLLTATAVAAFAVAATAGAHGLAAAKTTVTIKGPNGDFQGTILSTRKSCLANRIISLYKQKGQKQNRRVDTKLDTTTSERHGKVGEWSMGNTGFKGGRFYVHARKTSSCLGANSKTIRVPA